MSPVLSWVTRIAWWMYQTKCKHHSGWPQGNQWEAEISYNLPLSLCRVWGHKARTKSAHHTSHMKSKKICRIASIGHYVVKRECTQSKVLGIETLLIPMINLHISTTSYQENCATIFQPYPSSWLCAGGKQVGRGEKCTFPGTGFFFGRVAKSRTIWKCLSP